MTNFVAIVFDDSRKAYEGLQALWQLDDGADITVHGTGVIHRDELGHIQVDTKDTHPALGTALGVGIGALLGALAGAGRRSCWRGWRSQYRRGNRRGGRGDDGSGSRRYARRS